MTTISKNCVSLSRRVGLVDKTEAKNIIQYICTIEIKKYLCRDIRGRLQILDIYYVGEAVRTARRAELECQVTHFHVKKYIFSHDLFL